jgi:two-component system OmpR family response regulator
VARPALQKILYVEDDSSIQLVAKLALEALGGYTVGVCSSGQEALDVVSSFSPDLILLDIMMPGMDGPATLEALRKRPECAQIPVVFVTAKAQPREVAHYTSLGAAGLITKPFDPMALPDSVRSVWEAASAQAHPLAVDAA